MDRREVIVGAVMAVIVGTFVLSMGAEKDRREAERIEAIRQETLRPKAPGETMTDTRETWEVLEEIEAKTACNVRLQDAARVLFAVDRVLFRWTATDLDARFPSRRRADDPNVVTYAGRALQFQDTDGSWLTAVYECDWNVERAAVVDVRTSVGERLR